MRVVTTCEKLNKFFIENSTLNLMHLLSWTRIDTWFACYMNFWRFINYKLWFIFLIYLDSQISIVMILTYCMISLDFDFSNIVAKECPFEVNSWCYITHSKCLRNYFLQKPILYPSCFGYASFDSHMWSNIIRFGFSKSCG
jgi:hypothetical protein